MNTRIRAILRPAKDESLSVTLDWPSGTTSQNATITPTQASTSDLLAYWSAQQGRVAAHESARYNFSAFIGAGSLVALAEIGDGQMLLAGGIAVALSVIAANIVALRFTLGELRWIKIHQTRAATVLWRLLPEVKKMETQSNKQWGAREESGDNSLRFTSSLALQIMHLLLVVVALVMAVALVLK